MTSGEILGQTDTQKPLNVPLYAALSAGRGRVAVAGGDGVVHYVVWRGGHFAANLG